jgi:hypothetical protein
MKGDRMGIMILHGHHDSEVRSWQDVARITKRADPRGCASGWHARALVQEVRTCRIGVGLQIFKLSSTSIKLTGTAEVAIEHRMQPVLIEPAPPSFLSSFGQHR